MTSWEILEIEQTNDKKAIKKAYAKKLKKMNREEDVASFQELKEAFDRAINWTKNQKEENTNYIKKEALYNNDADSMEYKLSAENQKELSSVLYSIKNMPDVNIKIDYCGKVLKENSFLVGYGLDYNELERNVPYVYIAKPEDIDRWNEEIQK